MKSREALTFLYILKKSLGVAEKMLALWLQARVGWVSAGLSDSYSFVSEPKPKAGQSSGKIFFPGTIQIILTRSLLSDGTSRCACIWGLKRVVAFNLLAKSDKGHFSSSVCKLERKARILVLKVLKQGLKTSCTWLRVLCPPIKQHLALLVQSFS